MSDEDLFYKDVEGRMEELKQKPIKARDKRIVKIIRISIIDLPQNSYQSRNQTN